MFTTSKSHGFKHIYTGKQNLRLKTHRFPQGNSGEQDEAQNILIGCHYSNGKNAVTFHKITLFFSQNRFGTFYRFKTEMQHI